MVTRFKCLKHTCILREQCFLLTSTKRELACREVGAYEACWMQLMDHVLKEFLFLKMAMPGGLP